MGIAAEPRIGATYCLMRQLSLGAAVLAAVLASVRAQAQDADASAEDQARAHFHAGASYMETGDYDLAIREFERAYSFSPRAGLLYNIYVAHERLGHLDQAIEYLDRYLTEGGDAVENRLSLEQRLVRLRQRRDAGHETPEPRPDGPGPDTSPAPTGGGDALPIPAVITIAIGGAILINFAIFAGLAASEDGSLAQRCGRDAGMTCTDEDVATLDTYNIVADVSLGVGLGVAAAGAILWIVMGSSGSSQSASRVLPYASTDGAGAVWVASW
jgi:tetratricopeptide (TPR) repeat protein